MNAEESLMLARRFIGLPLEKRRLFLEGLREEGVDFSLLPIPAGVEAEERDAPSYAQRRMWFLWQLEPGSGAYNLPMAVRLHGELDQAALRRAFDALVARHEALRTRFRQVDEGVRQQVLAPAALAIGVEDLTPLAPAEREERVRALAEAEATAPFDLAEGPLLRVRLLRLAEREHVLLLTLHHIVADGWSLNLLIDEFLRCYDAACDGVDAGLPALPIQYRDHALWQRSWLEAGEGERQLAYWRDKLGDEHAPLELPIDHPRPARPSHRGARHALRIDSALAERLRALARRHNVTLFMVLLAAFKLLLQRYSGQRAIRVGVPIANRHRAEVEGVIGCFINTQVLHTEIDPLIDVAELLRRVRETALGAQAHQDLPFERLVEAFEPERSLGRNPLFQVLFNHQSAVVDAARITTRSGLTLEPVELARHSARFDLSLDTHESAGRLHAVFTYALDVFEGSTIEAMQRHWLQLLEGLAAESGCAVGELPLALAAPQWLAERTGGDGEGQCIHWLIERAAGMAPLRVAAVAGGREIDYRTLNERANALARVLLESGVRPDQRVGVIADRSIDMLVGILAALKAGAAYLPLEPDQPRERQDFMLADSDARWVLARADWHGELPDGVRRIRLDEGLRSADAPAVRVVADNLAYVIYTSGTSGTPKGVAVSHAALVNYVQGVSRRLALDEIQSLAMVSTPAADLGHTVLYGALCAGKTLHLPDRETLLDADAFAAHMNRHALDALKIVPSHLQAMLAAGAAALPRRCLILGGESCSAGLLQRIAALAPGLRVINHYGPTETTVGVLTHELSGQPLLGRPLDNIRVQVLSDCLQTVPGAARGELYVAGPALARGYLRRAALTAERFVPDPGDARGGRMYRTGDWVRGNGKGELVFAGRRDGQVKIRGHRVELAEVESRLRQLPIIGGAVVRLLGEEGSRQLAAWLVPATPVSGEEAQRAWLDAVRHALTLALPEHMRPSHLLVLERLPVTANGKVDVRALPAPVANAARYVAPSTPLQIRLAAIWAEVLQVERVGLSDNFFSLGGDSIMSIQVVSRARRAGIQLTARDLFQYQTLQELSRIARPVQVLALDQGEVLGESPLTPIQLRFFAADIAERHHWNQSVLLKPGKALDTRLLEQALRALVIHHDALRLSFVAHPQGWRARYRSVAEQQAHWERQGILWHLCLDGSETLGNLCDEAQRSLDLETALLRAVYVELPEGERRLLLVIHHLVVDGVSWRVLLEDLQQAYAALAASAEVRLPGKTSAFKAWAQRLQEHAQDAVRERELAYWREQLQGAGDELPCDFAEGGRRQKHAALASTRLERDWTRRLLQEAGHAYRTQINDLLLTALARVICRWTRQSSVLIRLEGHGREELFEDVDVTRTVGWFTSLFPVRLCPAAGMADSIMGVKERLRAVPDKGIGYGLLRYLGSERARQCLEALPEGQIVFNYLGQFDQSFAAREGLLAPAPEGSGQGQSEEAPLGSLIALNGQVYGGELELTWTFSRELFDEATIQRLADEYAGELKALIAHCCDGRNRGVTPSDFPLARLTQAQLDALPVAAAQIEDIYPLSPMQRGMLFHSLYQQGAEAYVNQTRVDVTGLDVERFRSAWQGVLEAHEVLRSAFVWLGELEQPVQVVRRSVRLPFDVHDWRERPALAEALHELARNDRLPGFELTRAPLLRLTLVRTADDRHHLIYTHHHILMDGWSGARLFAEVLQRYAGQAPARATGRYRDYIAWLQRQDAAAGEAFWREQLAVLEAPTRLAATGAAAPGAEGHGEHVRSLGAAQTGRLKRFAQATKVTLNTLVQGAWALLLQRCTGQRAVAFGATVSGRPAELPGVEEQVGLFINTLPVIAAPRPEQTVGEWLQALQAQNLALREREHTPLYEIQRWAGLGGEALFDSLLVFENYPVSQALEHGAARELRFGPVANHERTNYPLTLGVNLGETLSLPMSFDQAHFCATTIERLGEQLLHLLLSFSESAERRLGEISLASAEEHAWQQANNQPRPCPTTLMVHQRFAQLAAQGPERTAVIFDGRRHGYAELDMRANRLAHELVARGVGAEVRVGVALPRSEGLIVALLAVLKAGGAYVPLDTTYPRERLAYQIRDAGLALLLTDTRVSARLPVDAALPVLELDRFDPGGHPRHAPQVALDPDNLAYVIYTSGSSGNPKGVGVAHGPLAMHCQAIGERYEMRDGDCELHFMSFAFDGAHERWLTSLTHGASLLIRDDSLWTPEQTYRAMIEHGVSVAAFPPVYLQQLSEYAERVGNPPQVRVYCFGGDAVANAGFERARRALRPQYIINGYGPTETVVTPLIWKAGRDMRCGAAYAPIGSRIGDRSAYVLDADLNLLPRGVAGELYLGGRGLARGYLNRPGLTAERFVADPFCASGGLLYRTGDRVRQRADGTFDYLERIDDQVKIRGFRIELGEIEAHLRALDGVREAVVVAREGVGGKRLLAYVTGDAPGEDFAGRLRERLKASLPAYMVPACVSVLERMPLTPNGKLDRKALPEPDADQARQAYQAPRSELEQRLAAIWQDVLKLPRVGLDDNFFELGGDSIISLQVVGRARQEGIRFTPKDLFQHQTVQALAAVAQRGESPPGIDQRPVTGAIVPLPIHQLFFSRAIPDRHHWNQSVMLEPTRPLEAQVLEQALRALVIHHDGLRLEFVERDGSWTARYRDSEAACAEAILWQAEAADPQALEALGNQAQRSLRLSGGSLLRAVLANLADGSQRLLLIVHHLVVDGVSWRILFEDLQSAYRQLLAGESVRLPAKTSSVKDWSEALQGYAGGAPLQAELQHWQRLLQGPSPALPGADPDGGQRHCQALVIRSRLDKSLTRQLLQEAPAAYRTQVGDLLLTALARVMVRWTGGDSVLVQLEGHGREELFDGIDLTRTVGWFTSLFPVRLAPAADLGASLKRIKEQLRAIPHKGIGFGALAYLGDDHARQALDALPTPRLTFNYLGQFDGSFDAADALFVPSGESRGEELNMQGPLGNQLALDGKVFGGELNLNWTFSGGMFAEASIQRLADAYRRELGALIAHCCDPANRGVTPSDFPLAALSQAQLDALAVPPRQIEDIYPLSPMQQGMLFHSLLRKGDGDYINQLRLDVDGLDPQRFRAAWQAVVDAHEVLRTGFFWEGALAEPVQVVLRQVEMPFSVLDWRGRGGLEAALQTLADEERAKGMELTRAPLMRLVLVRTAADRHHLIHTSHHILMDGWSSGQLLGEVLQRYRGEAVARPTGRYRDYIAWLRRQQAGAAEAYWLAALGELREPTHLARAMARPGGDLPAAGHGSHCQVLDAGLTQRLSAFARASKVTVNTLVQAAWSLLLRRYTGKHCVAFGATVAGRPAELPGAERLVGLFINTLPVIVSPGPQQRLAAWLQELQAQNLALREFEYTPLADIQRWAGQGGEALFDSLLVFENYPIAEALERGAPPGLRFGPPVNHEQTNYPLTLLVHLGAELSIRFSYRRDSFAAAGVAQLGGHLQRLLVQMAEGGERTLDQLTLVDASVPADGTGFVTELCIHQAIARQVAATPDALAVTFADRQLTYAELDAWANRVAHKLIELGVGPEVRVGVAMQRSERLLVALLAVFKAGGAYVPLDPDYPAERVAYMLRDSRARVLLTEQAVAASLAPTADTQVLALDPLADWPGDYPASAPHTRVAPDNLAYVIYTSGSTGRPKGVAIAHRNVMALIDWSARVYRREDIQGVLAATSVCFDLSVWELFVTLANGGSLIIARNALELPRLPARDRVRLINGVPSAIAALQRAGQIPASVRIINLAGEPLRQGLVDALYRQPTVEHVYDLYGPSEDTTYSTWTRRTAGGQARIGRALEHSASHVLDADLHPLPQGVAAELHLAGAGLCRGYLARPALTAERFVPDPFGRAGERLYRTGDLVRQRDDGELEYMGRIDHQVKIRGFRIELGEIEAALLAHPAVGDAAVLAREAEGGMQLVAYVVAPRLDADDGEAQRQLRDGLKTSLGISLPDYMIPAHLLFLAQLPLTPNGKLDRKALPEVATRDMQAVYVAPRSELERRVAAIWQHVLGVERIGLGDHFFELGGHSLLAVNVVSRMALELGLTLTPQALFQYPVLSDFVARLDHADEAIDERKLDRLEALLGDMEEV